jgi:CMP-N-acetylneuraminic acid synthetase
MTDAIAFVFARGGSKGIADKNLQQVGGLSLVARAIKCAQESQLFDHVVVSTDSTAIAKEATRFGAEVPALRPAELASDSSPEIDSWRHAIGWFSDRSGRPVFSRFVSVPPTTPLKTADDLQRALNALDADCDIVVSAIETSAHPSYALVKKDENGFARLFLPTTAPIHRRQDASTAYALCSTVYASTPEHLQSARGVLDGRVRILEVDRRAAVDIDDEFDLEVARLLAG